MDLKKDLKSIDDSITRSNQSVLKRRLNFRMIRNVLLVWLDNEIDEQDDNCQNILTQLRRVVYTVEIYKDVDQCIDFLQTTRNDKICIIISDSLSEDVVPRIYDIVQVNTIFIFDRNKRGHEQWIKEWPKIKGIFIEITPICETLQTTARISEQNSIPISFISTNEDILGKKLDQLESSFMYSQILKEILLSITFQREHFEKFIQYCRQVLFNNGNEPNSLKEFEQDYYNKTPIWWYSCPSFIYDTLNSALRLMDANTIIHMGFLINDLHHEIVQLHRQQFPADREYKTFTLYRGQALSTAHFKQLCQTKGGLLSFNNFLSTSADRQLALGFTHAAEAIPDVVGILFIMSIDPRQSSTPFASIANVSYYEDQEHEVLFSMHAVFRIGDITSLNDDDRLFEVTLTLTNDDDEDLRRLTDYNRGQPTSADKGWFHLGSLLMKMGQAGKAQEIYEILLEQSVDEDERAWIFDQLGHTHDAQGNYKEAITLYEKSLVIREQSSSLDGLALADSYSHIGAIYSKMNDYEKAVSYNQSALAIREQLLLPPNHADLADSFNSIGGVYYNMVDYAEALSSFEKALAIREQSLLPNHPDLATSYHNIGTVHLDMNDYPKALESFEKALSIRQRSLLPNDPILATSYNNIGSIYFAMNDHEKALSFYKKAQSILQQSLPSKHPSLARSFGNIGQIYSDKGDYANALSSFETALTIQQESLSPNHPDLAITYNHIGLAYDKMREYAKAISFFEKALAINQQSPQSNQLHMAATYNNIGLVYYNTNDYLKALPFF